LKGPAQQHMYRQQQYQQQMRHMQQQSQQQYTFYKAAGKERFEAFTEFAKITEKSDRHTLGGDGTRKTPARTCGELFRAYEVKESGDYWVDPNEGSNHDATLVYCDKKTLATCVYPKFTTVGEWEWEDMKKKKSSYQWMAQDFLQLNEIEYAMDISQMKILHLLTEYAQQNITFNCKNSLLKDDILRFKFFNEQTLSYGKKTSAVLIKTVENACKNTNDNKWHKAVIELGSQTNLLRLPLVDVSAFNVGRPSEQFGFKLGPVCYV